MTKKYFTKSIKVLIVVMLTLMAFSFLNREFMQWMMVLAIVVWAISMVCKYAMPWLKKKLRSILLDIADRDVTLDDGDFISDTLMMEELMSKKQLLLFHVTQRIDDKLRPLFPQLEWEWIGDNHDEVIRDGGTTRIKTINAGDFAYANVTIDSHAEIKLELISVVSLDAIPVRPAVLTVTKAGETMIDLSTWYSTKGSAFLRQIIQDANAIGRTKIHLDETGDVYTTDSSGNEVKYDTIQEWPGKDSWAELAALLTKEELKVGISAEQFQITWA